MNIWDERRGKWAVLLSNCASRHVILSPSLNSDNMLDLLNKKGLTEKTIVRDINYPNIYVRKLMKSEVSTSGQASKKKHDRVYNSYHACYCCGELVQHIPVHMKKHKYKIEDVREKFANSDHPDFSLERKLGDNKHNKKVIEEKWGELLLSRRLSSSCLDVKMYGPCINCFEWMLLCGLKRHYLKCSTEKNSSSAEKQSSDTYTSRDLVLKSQIVGGFLTGDISVKLRDEVMKIMRKDKVADVAFKDSLIMTLGESWLMRNVDNAEKRSYYASQHMRLCARLLLELRSSDDRSVDNENVDHVNVENVDPVNDGNVGPVNDENVDTVKDRSMWDYLTPACFDQVATAALAVSMPWSDDLDDLKSPSNAIKLKYDIRRLVNAKYAYLLKRDQTGTDCKSFLQLMKIQWAEKVTKLARTVLQKRKLIERKELPSPADIEKMTRYTTKKLAATPLTKENYWDILKLTQTRLLLFNKRRSGELEVAK